ncbi:MAG: hypothetical protein QXW32_06105 [Nitrososphaerales archaeon]
MTDTLPRTKRVAIITLFGVIVFASKIIPTPIDKMFVIVQALLFAVGSLLLGRMGATYIATVGGLLTTIWRPSFAPFSLIFAIIYGLLVDLSFHTLKVKTSHGDLNTGRLIGSLSLSTAIIGLLSTYITVSIGMMPIMPTLYIIILMVGVASGAVGGYLASYIYRKYLIRYTSHIS